MNFQTCHILDRIRIRFFSQGRIRIRLKTWRIHNTAIYLSDLSIHFSCKITHTHTKKYESLNAYLMLKVFLVETGMDQAAPIYSLALCLLSIYLHYTYIYIYIYISIYSLSFYSLSLYLSFHIYISFRILPTVYMKYVNFY